MEIFKTEEELVKQGQVLEEQRSLRKQRGVLAKEFLESEFLLQFLLPDIEVERLGAYPSPTEKDWENKYRYAYAKDEVYSGFMKKIQSWVEEAQSITKEEDNPPKEIV